MQSIFHDVWEANPINKGVRMNFKKLAMALSITAAFCYMGCEDSTSASSAGGDDDQPTLSSDSKGGDDGQNTKSSDSKDNTGGDEKTTSSASNGEGEGDGGGAASSGDSAPESSSSVGGMDLPIDTTGYSDLMKCDEEGATQEQYGFTMTCTEGQWTVDSSSIANMMNCDTDGETKESFGMVMVCKDGQWAYDSTASAAANACDEEGATKTETMTMGTYEMEMKYTCKDGQWQMDFGGMGGMEGWGDSSFTMPGGGMNFGDSSFTMPGGGTGGWGARDSSGAFSGGRSDWGQWLNDRDSSSTQPAGE